MDSFSKNDEKSKVKYLKASTSTAPIRSASGCPRCHSRIPSDEANLDSATSKEDKPNCPKTTPGPYTGSIGHDK